LQPFGDHGPGEPFEVPAVRSPPAQHGLRQAELGRLLDRDRINRGPGGTAASDRANGRYQRNTLSSASANTLGA
jgi:hypothetical protein